MKYFENQEHAVQIFDKLANIPDEHRVIYIIVNTKHEIEALIHDLKILLQRFPLEVRKNGIRVKGTKTNKPQSIIILVEKDLKPGIRPEQCLYLNN